MTSNAEELATSSNVATPVARTSTPKLVVWALSLLGAVTLLAASYKNAVEALSEAKQATVNALATEPVTEASYNELAKTITDLSTQLKSTQSELALLADYVRVHPATGSSASPQNIGTPTPAERAPPASAPSGPPPSLAGKGPAAALSVPSELVERTRKIEATPLPAPRPFSAVRSQARSNPVTR
jgi:hypothetical protein